MLQLQEQKDNGCCGREKFWLSGREKVFVSDCSKACRYSNIAFTILLSKMSKAILCLFAEFVIHQRYMNLSIFITSHDFLILYSH